MPTNTNINSMITETFFQIYTEIFVSGWFVVMIEGIKMFPRCFP